MKTDQLARGHVQRRSRKLSMDWLEDRQMLASDLAGLLPQSPAVLVSGANAAAPAAPTLHAASAIRASASGVLSTKIVPYDATTRVALTLDLGTGSYYANAEIANGLTYDTDKIK